jgi:hypothetical protein
MRPTRESGIPASHLTIHRFLRIHTGTSVRTNADSKLTAADILGAVQPYEITSLLIFSSLLTGMRNPAILELK